MPLTRNFKVAAKTENQWATPVDHATLFAAANMRFLPLDASLEFTPNIIERGIKQGTLTPAKGIVGLKTGKFALTHELVNPNDAYILEPFLVACGLMRLSVCKVKVSSGGIKKNGAAAMLKHGTKVYYGTAGALDTSHYSTVLGDYYDGDPCVFLAYDQTGLRAHNWLWAANTGGNEPPADGNVVADATNDSATTTTKFTVDTAGVVTSGGAAFFPVSRPFHQLFFTATATATINAGDILQTASGSTWQAMHAVSFASTNGVRVAVVNVSGHVVAGEGLVNVTQANASIGTMDATLNNAEQQIAGGSLTCGIWKDGVEEILGATRGSCEFTFKDGEPATVKFDLQGVYASHEDAAQVTGISYPSPTPPICQSAGVQFRVDSSLVAADLSNPCVTQVSLNLGVEVNARQCMSSANGVLEYEITGRKPSGKLDPELYAEASFATLAKFLANTNCSLFLKIANPTPESRNKYWFWVPTFAMTGVATGDRNGRATREISFSPNTGSAGYVAKDIDGDFVLIMDRAPTSFG